MKYWLMKSEPEVFSITALERAKTSLWDGVRNYQARNFMTTDMQVGDEVLFYHSNAEPSGVAGIARVVGPAEPDPTQFDKKSDYYDPKASKQTPRWFGVRIAFVEKFKAVLPLEALRQEPSLSEMQLLKKGQRLSIQPVSAKEFECIRQMARR